MLLTALLSWFSVIGMSSNTLTVRNLDDAVKQKLRLQAARHGQSMEAEAREILARGVLDDYAFSSTQGFELAEPVPTKGKFGHLVGIWKGRTTTDELMRATRGED